VEDHLGGNADALASWLVLRPAFGQVQTPGQGLATGGASRVEAHGHLAVRQFAQCAAVLALHPHRVFAFLGETRVINDPEGFSLLGADSSRQLLPDRFPRPRAWADKLWQGLFLAIRETRDHGADTLAFSLQQEAPHIGLPPVAAVLPPQRG
jgi:hypothetical protein